jgi:DNA polymerase-3 subunit epsilon
MKLKLKRPICFFDLETTGTNTSTDRIVEIAITKIYPDGKEEVKCRKLNPTIPIPIESSLIHGIYDDDVKNEPTFIQVAKGIFELMKDCDLGGFNSNKFDIPLLLEEFHRAEIEFNVENINLVDVQNIFHQMEQRTLVAAYKFYCNKDLTNAHSASADTNATYEVLKSMLDKYENTEFINRDNEVSIPVINDMQKLAEFSKRNNNVDLSGRFVFNKNEIACFNFGKHKGKPVEQVLLKEESYYSWMMKGEFSIDTKKHLERFWKDVQLKKEKIKLQLLQNKFRE